MYERRSSKAKCCGLTTMIVAKKEKKLDYQNWTLLPRMVTFAELPRPGGRASSRAVSSRRHQFTISLEMHDSVREIMKKHTQYLPIKTS